MVFSISPATPLERETAFNPAKSRTAAHQANRDVVDIAVVRRGFAVAEVNDPDRTPKGRGIGPAECNLS